MKTNPVLLDVPMELKTERLLLRAPRAGDGSIVFPQVRDSLAELKPWMPWAKDDYKESDAEEWCRKSAAHFLAREQFQFLMFLREASAHIGNIGLFKFNWDVPSCEVGYWLQTGRTGRGYMSEAVKGLTEFAYATFKAARVQLLTDDRNERSFKVAERCGYQLEGTLRCDCRRSEGNLRNTRVYSKLNPEAWTALPNQ